MKTIDLIVTFDGIEVATAPVLGKTACGLTVGRLIDGREQESNYVLFAYQDDNVWKTTFFNAQPGQFRLTLISATLRWFHDITINDEVLANGVLHVEFCRYDCRWQWIPVFIKRWWWKLREYRKRRRDAPSRDGRVLSQGNYPFASGSAHLITKPPRPL